MRGRKPEPIALRMLRGNPGKRPIPPDVPQPTAIEDPPPPEWMDGDAQSEWRRIVPLLTRERVLTEMDLSGLVTYCEAWATWKTATQKIRQFGMVLRSDTGTPFVSPYVMVAKSAFQEMHAMLLEFGMTPSSRVRVRAQKTMPTVSKWAGL
jgi:P27 family predicted phage terminase small subunit